MQQLTGHLDTLTSIGVLVTPRADGRRSFDTTMVAVAGDLSLDDDELEAFRELWAADAISDVDAALS